MFAQAISRVSRTSVRGISTSAVRSDLSRLTLIGRLGNDPVVRTSEKTGAQYVVYPIATSAGSPGPADESGKRADPPTSWHSVWSFQERSNDYLTTLGKGSTVYVEADLTMKEQIDEDGKRTSSPFVLHRNLKVINKMPRADAEAPEADSE